MSLLILLLALSCAGNLLFGQSSWAFTSIRRSLQTLLYHRWGPRAARGFLLSELDFFSCEALYLSSTVVWTAVGIIVVSSLVRSARRSQNRRDTLAVAELSSYIRRRISEFTGQHEPSWIDQHEKSRTYYLEEFEILIDELLLRLDVLSNYLQHTLPLKAHHYMEESPNMDIQNFVRKQMTEETTVSHHTDSRIQGDTRPPSYMSRSKFDLQRLQSLQQRGQQRTTSSSDIVLTSDYRLQTGKRSEENQNCLPLPESVSLSRIWTEDVLEKQSNLWTKTIDSDWLVKTQANHKEVTVEVLVHKEPGIEEPDKQEGLYGDDGTCWIDAGK